MKHHRHASGTAPAARSAGRRLSALLLSIVFLLTAAAAFAAVARAGTDPDAPPPSISSDKADYAPGELVTLHGSNWAPGESVTVVVNDDAGQTWRRDVDVVADESGAISDQFNLPDWFVAVYTVTATGASGTATTTFTDGNVNIKTGGVASASVDWVRYSTINCTGSPAASDTITAVSSGNGTGIPSGAASGESLRLSAASIAGFAFTSWSGGNVSPDPSTANPICVAGRNATQQITLTYTGDTSVPTPVSISINGGAAWTNSSTGAVTLGLSATDNVGITRYRLAETQAGLGSASDVAVSPAEASFTRSGVSFTLTGAEAASKAVWLRVCDAANNCTDASDTIGWDKTAPTDVATALDRGPDHNGWYNHAVDWTTSGTDATSGIDSCSSGTYDGPDGTGNTVSGHCTDVAGNSSADADSAAFDYDTTTPSVSATPSRPADHNGWYNHAFSVSYSGTDATSGIDSCSAADAYSGPDTASDSLTGGCTDNAGNSDSASYGFKYDATEPSVSATPSRPADHNGWYNHAFSVSYSGTDGTSGIDSCSAADAYSGPDTASDSLTGSCTDNAGNSDSASYGFKYDATAPTGVATALDRGSDHNGWYNHAVGWTTSGTDATSGIDACSSGTYSGPDGSGNTVSGHCTDVAGNSSADADSAAFDYDATAPTLNPSVSPNPVVLNGSATASPNASDDLSGVDSSSCDPVDTSSVGAKSVACAATDKAGNTSGASASYSVVYDWSGFFRPVDNLPGLNKAKAGSAIPVKFSLAGNQGMAIFMNGYPTSAPVVCGSTASADLVEETVTAGQSSLNYDAAAGQYVYVWKTNTGWANTCRTLTLKLVDGTVHQANFWFVK